MTSLAPLFSLEGRSVAATEGASGHGLALAEALMEASATVSRGDLYATNVGIDRRVQKFGLTGIR